MCDTPCDSLSMASQAAPRLLLSRLLLLLMPSPAVASQEALSANQRPVLRVTTNYRTFIKVLTNQRPVFTYGVAGHRTEQPGSLAVTQEDSHEENKTLTMKVVSIIFNTS